MAARGGRSRFASTFDPISAPVCFSAATDPGGREDKPRGWGRIVSPAEDSRQKKSE